MQDKASDRAERLPSQARRALLLRAAIEAFAEHGYDQSTLRDIASRAGVTTPILYRFVDSKIDLYRQVIDAAAATLIDVWSSLPVGGPPENYFKVSTSAFFSWIELHRQEWRLLFGDPPRDVTARGVLQQVRAEADRAMAQVLVAIGVSPPAGLDERQFLGALAAQVTGAGNALASWWWFHQDVSATEVAAMNHGVIWPGLDRMVGDGLDSGQFAPP